MLPILDYLLAPVRLPLRLLEDVHRIADAAEDVRKSLKPLEDDIDGLREAFEGSNRELAALRDAFTPHFARLHAELLSLRAQLGPQIDSMQSDLSDVSDVVEPLEGAAERVGRMADRLPGGGRG